MTARRRELRALSLQCEMLCLAGCASGDTREEEARAGETHRPFSVRGEKEVLKGQTAVLISPQVRCFSTSRMSISFASVRFRNSICIKKRKFTLVLFVHVTGC